MARQLGLVRTWPNVQTIRLAIESEAELTGASLAEAAAVISKAAREYTQLPQFICSSDWQKREIYRENVVDRFWFEDARWRTKGVYLEWRAEASA